MKIKEVWTIYFSPTGTTEKIAKAMGEGLSHSLDAPLKAYDFTLPKMRENFPALGPDSLVVFAMPTYAGKLPNLMLPYLDTMEGEGALAVAMVTFGNRNFDNSLAELWKILDSKGFTPFAGGAFAAEHSFSYTLGAGRPDGEDLQEVSRFSKALGESVKASALEELAAGRAEISGDGDAPYYQPRDRKGVFIDIRKVKPKTLKSCIRCGLCADQCPMGAIDKEDFSLISGICIKCGACVKKCPVKAKFFDDPGFIYHKEELEAMYGGERQKNRLFYPSL